MGEDHPHRAKQGVALPRVQVLTCAHRGSPVYGYGGEQITRPAPVLGVWRPQAPWGLSPGVCGGPGQRRPDRISASPRRGLRRAGRNPGGPPGRERWERACAAGGWRGEEMGRETGGRAWGAFQLKVSQRGRLPTRVPWAMRPPSQLPGPPPTSRSRRPVCKASLIVSKAMPVQTPAPWCCSPAFL